MFYSKSIDEIKVNFFLNLLLDKMAGNALQEDNYIQAVLADTKALATGDKSFYTIDRDNYPIIAALHDHDPNYFRDLDIEHLTNEDYRKIHKLLLNQPEYA